MKYFYNTLQTQLSQEGFSQTEIDKYWDVIEFVARKTGGSASPGVVVVDDDVFAKVIEAYIIPD